MLTYRRLGVPPLTDLTGATFYALVDGYRVINNNKIFIWQANETYERYFERTATQDPSLLPVTDLVDYMTEGGQDQSETGSDSPSQPQDAVDGTCDAIGEGDDPFVQVSIFPAQ